MDEAAEQKQDILENIKMFCIICTVSNKRPLGFCDFEKCHLYQYRFGKDYELEATLKEAMEIIKCQ